MLSSGADWLATEVVSVRLGTKALGQVKAVFHLDRALRYMEGIR